MTAARTAHTARHAQCGFAGSRDAYAARCVRRAGIGFSEVNMLGIVLV